MRLTHEQVEDIRSVVTKRDPGASVFLFGSRTDDSRRGGDVDILVLSRLLGAGDRRAMKLDLYRRLGWRKIDLLLARDTSKPFVRLALERGIKL
jgi:predicted nucleotidyltransferase